MNIDFHVHGLLSKRKDFNQKFFIQEIRTAKESGLDGIVLCEHFNSKSFLDIHQFLEKNYNYDGHSYLVEEIKIFPGIEVSIEGNGHIILVGHRLAIIEIYQSLKNYWCKENHISLEDLLDLADKYNCLKIGAHPLRRGHKLTNKNIETLKRLDCLDLNAKDIFKKGEEIAKYELQDFSIKVNKNIVTGSDSHTPLQLGAIMTKIYEECESIDQLRSAIIKGNYDVVISKNLEFKVYTSKILKRYLISSRTFDYNSDFKL